MPQYTVRAGVDTYILYGQEASYGVAPATINKHFGIVSSVSPSPKNELKKIRGFRGTNPAANTSASAVDTIAHIPGKFSGNIGVEFAAQHFQWLEYVLGSVSGLGTAASKFNYPQATASTDADKKKYTTVPSMTISSNFNFGGSAASADKKWDYLGCKVTSCTIKAQVGEEITVSLDLQFASVAGNTTLTAPVALDTAGVYTFSGADVEYPTSTSIPNVIEGFTLTITRDITQLHGCGTGNATRTAKDAKEKTRDISLSLDLTAEGTTFMNDFLGTATAVGTPAVISSITLKFTGDTNHNCAITCYNCMIADDSMSQSYPEVVKEKINIQPTHIMATEQITA